MELRLFITVKKTLDLLYPDLPDEKDAFVQQKLELLRENYKGLHRGNMPDYSDLFTRFAYLYCYVPFHANVVYKLLNRNSQEFAQVFNKSEINVACIGGGAGSDLLGILKYTLESGHKKIPRFQIYDRQNLWQDVLNNLKIICENSESRFFALQLKPLPRVCALDATNFSEQEQLSELKEADLFTFSFLISELYPKDAVNYFFQTLFEQAKPGAVFLFVDNIHTNLWFDYSAESHIVTLDQGTEEFCMDSTERLDHLSPHFGRYCDRNGFPSKPRLKASVVFRICRKG